MLEPGTASRHSAPGFLNHPGAGGYVSAFPGALPYFHQLLWGPGTLSPVVHLRQVGSRLAGRAKVPHGQPETDLGNSMHPTQTTSGVLSPELQLPSPSQDTPAFQPAPPCFGAELHSDCGRMPGQSLTSIRTGQITMDPHAQHPLCLSLSFRALWWCLDTGFSVRLSILSGCSLHPLFSSPSADAASVPRAMGRVCLWVDMWVMVVPPVLGSKVVLSSLLCPSFRQCLLLHTGYPLPSLKDPPASLQFIS